MKFSILVSFRAITFNGTEQYGDTTAEIEIPQAPERGSMLTITPDMVKRIRGDISANGNGGAGYLNVVILSISPLTFFV